MQYIKYLHEMAGYIQSRNAMKGKAHANCFMPFSVREDSWPSYCQEAQHVYTWKPEEWVNC